MAWYVDTSAFVKLVVAEPESAALRRWIAGGRGRSRPELFSSDLLRTEALRTARRHSPQAATAARRALDALTLVKLTSEIFERAAELDPAILRTLDALHLSAALTLGDELEGIVTYDERLCDAAGRHAVAVCSPGPSPS